jgi:hypothetical protein
MISLATIEESINKAAYGYTDKHVGPKEEVGNKGGSLCGKARLPPQTRIGSCAAITLHASRTTLHTLG